MHLSDIFPRITERVVILLNALCYFKVFHGYAHEGFGNREGIVFSKRLSTKGR